MLYWQNAELFIVYAKLLCFYIMIRKCKGIGWRWVSNTDLISSILTSVILSTKLISRPIVNSQSPKEEFKVFTWVGSVAVGIMHWCAMKVLQASAVLIVLNIGAVSSQKVFPFRVRQVSNETIYDGPQTRIYGGMVAPESKFPFMIFVIMKVFGDTMSQCSASLFHPEWVLLAAHCVDFRGLSPDNIITVGGKANLAAYVRERLLSGFHTPIDENQLGVQERRALNFFVHPNYNREILEHDVALIKVKKPFVLDSITLIPLSENKMRSKQGCTILGWGLTAGNKQTYRLNYVENRIVSTTKLGCNHKLEGPFICLMPGTSKICQGDSGSPLVCDNEVWGVASHFVSYSQNPDCGDSMEEYYTEIHADLKWIRSVYNSGNLSSMISLKSVLLYVCSGIILSAII